MTLNWQYSGMSALRHLRWSGIDFQHGRIQWRAQHDKIGFEHVTPMSRCNRFEFSKASFLENWHRLPNVHESRIRPLAHLVRVAN